MQLFEVASLGDRIEKRPKSKSKSKKNTTKQSKSKSIDSQMEDPQLRQAAIDKARVGGGDKGLGV